MSVKVAFLGLGSYAPPKVMRNQDFEKLVDTSDEWITTRTGIKERRVCSNGEATSDLPEQEARIVTRVTQHGDTALFVSRLLHSGRDIEIQSGREYLSADGKVRTREFDLKSDPEVVLFLNR